MYFSKVHAVTIADFWFWSVLGEFLGKNANFMHSRPLKHHCPPLFFSFPTHRMSSHAWQTTCRCASSSVPVSALGGVPHSSRQEFLCSSGNIPKRIGEEKHEKTTVDLPIFDQASFRPASPPIFPLSISEYRQAAKQIGDRHRMLNWKQHAVTVADFWFGRFWVRNDYIIRFFCYHCAHLTHTFSCSAVVIDSIAFISWWEHGRSGGHG